MPIFEFTAPANDANRFPADLRVRITVDGQSGTFETNRTALGITRDSDEDVVVLAIAETLVVFATNGVDIADGRVFEQAREALDAMLDALHRPSVGAVCSTARGGCPQ